MCMVSMKFLTENFAGFKKVIFTFSSDIICSTLLFCGNYGAHSTMILSLVHIYILELMPLTDVHSSSIWFVFYLNYWDFLNL